MTCVSNPKNYKPKNIKPNGDNNEYKRRTDQKYIPCTTAFFLDIANMPFFIPIIGKVYE